MRSALEVDGRALADGGTLCLPELSGAPTELPVHVQTSAGTPGDAGLLEPCRGPVLDVRSGPSPWSAATHRRR